MKSLYSDKYKNHLSVFIWLVVFQIANLAVIVNIGHMHTEDIAFKWFFSMYPELTMNGSLSDQAWIFFHLVQFGGIIGSLPCVISLYRDNELAISDEWKLLSPFIMLVIFSSATLLIPMNLLIMNLLPAQLLSLHIFCIIVHSKTNEDATKEEEGTDDSQDNMTF